MISQGGAGVIVCEEKLQGNGFECLKDLTSTF